MIINILIQRKYYYKMEYLYLYIVDAFLLLGVIYGCCSTPREIKDYPEIEPLKNNELSYQEFDVEALYN
jgi:hypothetical protein